MANTIFSSAGQGVNALITGNMPNGNEFLARSILEVSQAQEGFNSLECYQGRDLRQLLRLDYSEAQ